MRANPSTQLDVLLQSTTARVALTALALLSGGSPPWACESRARVDDTLSGVASEGSERLTRGNDDASARFEPWYETCGEVDDSTRAGAADDTEARRNSRVNTPTSKSASATGAFALPSTAAYGWVAVRYTKGERCGSAKVYFDERLIETLDLYAADASQQCERVYYLEDRSATEHRFQATIEGGSGRADGGYACLDSVVAGW